MGVCIKLATRSLRKNKGRTLITLMGIVLSVLMVCTIFTLLNSMLDSAIDSIIEKDGNWHIAVYNTTAEQIADLEAAEGVLSTQMISIDENDVFRITLKNPDEVYEFASRYLSETTEYSYHTELLSYLGISQSESIKSLIMGDCRRFASYHRCGCNFFDIQCLCYIRFRKDERTRTFILDWCNPKRYSHDCIFRSSFTWDGCDTDRYSPRPFDFLGVA